MPIGGWSGSEPLPSRGSPTQQSKGEKDKSPLLGGVATWPTPSRGTSTLGTRQNQERLSWGPKSPAWEPRQ